MDAIGWDCHLYSVPEDSIFRRRFWLAGLGRDISVSFNLYCAFIHWAQLALKDPFHDIVCRSFCPKWLMCWPCPSCCRCLQLGSQWVNGSMGSPSRRSEGSQWVTWCWVGCSEIDQDDLVKTRSWSLGHGLSDSWVSIREFWMKRRRMAVILYQPFAPHWKPSHPIWWFP